MHKHESRRGRWVLSAALLIGGLSLACGGGGDTAADSPGVDTAMTPPPANAGGAGGATGQTAMIALGDSIFKGQAAGGICYTCHGMDAKGTALAPDLTDATWINTDGSMEGIVGIITNGVAQPKQHPAPMPPMGGAQLTQDQVRATAAYVYSLSHP